MLSDTGPGDVLPLAPGGDRRTNPPRFTNVAHNAIGDGGGRAAREAGAALGNAARMRAPAGDVRAGRGPDARGMESGREAHMYSRPGESMLGPSHHGASSAAPTPHLGAGWASGGPAPRGAARPPRLTRHGVLPRRGPLGWWLVLTAPVWPIRELPLEDRERLRKAELTSLSILAALLLLAVLASANATSLPTLDAILAAAIGLVVAAFFNRFGWTSAAAYLVPAVLTALVAACIVLADGGLQLTLLPAYDLFVLPIFLASLTGRRAAPWVFAILAAVFIIADLTLQPHALITAVGAANFDEVQYAMGDQGWWGVISRHLALIFFAALFGWLGALSVEGALARADRAEEIAALEHEVADQQRQLELGVHQILRTHARVANGDFTARAPLAQNHVLWQLANSLNNLVGRMQRSAQSEHMLQRTDAELRRLAVALDEAEAGKLPIWPAPTGTPADHLVLRFAKGQGFAPQIAAPSGIQPALHPASLQPIEKGMGASTKPALPGGPPSYSPLPSSDPGPHPLLVSRPIHVADLLDPDCWPAWLAESGAKKLGVPEEPAGPATTSPPAASSRLGVPAPATQPRRAPPSQSAALAPVLPAPAVEMPPNLADFMAAPPPDAPPPRRSHLPGASGEFSGPSDSGPSGSGSPSGPSEFSGSGAFWRSDARRKRAEALGPVPDPPWMAPGQ